MRAREALRGMPRLAPVVLALACAAAGPTDAVRATAPAEGAEPGAVSAPPPSHVDAVARGPALGERLEEIRRRVQDALEYPSLARSRGHEGVAVVGFEIGADRRARAVRLEQSSGSPTLDRAAERAVEQAAPLPHVYGRVEVPVRFELARD